MKKKLLLILMAITVLGCAVVGCGKDGENSKDVVEDGKDKNYGSLTAAEAETTSTYIGDVQNIVDGSSFLMNVAAIEGSSDEGFVGQMYVTLNEESMQYKELLTPGNLVIITLSDTDITNIVEAQDVDAKTLQDLRATVSTYKDDIEYIKNIPAEDIKEYVNSVYPSWTDEQIKEYHTFLEEFLTDSAVAEAYNSSDLIDRALTAEERAADYEANKENYEIVTEIISSDADNSEEVSEEDMPDKYDPTVEYTDEEMDHFIKTGVIILNEETGSISYPDGSPVVIGYTKEELEAFEADGTLIRNEDGELRFAEWSNDPVEETETPVENAEE